MNNPLEIKILKNTNDKDFEGLQLLIEQYVIYFLLKSKSKYANLDGDERIELMNKALIEFHERKSFSILDPNDINEINQELNIQLDSSKHLIDSQDSSDIKSRYYILKNANNVVGFMQAQIAKNNNRNRIEGLRNLSYLDPRYSGKTGETIDTFGNQFSGFYSEAIYQNISQWFGENEVEYEKISTGLNMSHHIMSYIKGKRFIPVDKDEEKLFLEKNLKKQLYRRTLSKIYRLYCMHESRTKPTTMQNVMDEINATPELLFLSYEQKIGLVKCFLRKEEKEKFKNQIQNSENKLEIPHEDSER